MSRSPFQVLVFPFWISPQGERLYAIFRRKPSTGGYWQGIAGGGEGKETPLEAARRESLEEAGIEPANAFVQLNSVCTIPVVNISGFRWGESVLVIPEYCFGVEIAEPRIRLSDEHTHNRWVVYDDGMSLLHWDSNKNALWELNYRITHNIFQESTDAVAQSQEKLFKTISRDTETSHALP